MQAGATMLVWQGKFLDISTKWLRCMVYSRYNWGFETVFWLVTQKQHKPLTL